MVNNPDLRLCFVQSTKVNINLKSNNITKGVRTFIQPYFTSIINSDSYFLSLSLSLSLTHTHTHTNTHTQTHTLTFFFVTEYYVKLFMLGNE